MWQSGTFTLFGADLVMKKQYGYLPVELQPSVVSPRTVYSHKLKACFISTVVTHKPMDQLPLSNIYTKSYLRKEELNKCHCFARIKYYSF